MSVEPPSLEPAPMEGDGAYNRHSRVQAATSLAASALFEQAAATVPLEPGPAAIVLADYGASSGRNSLAPMRSAIAALRARVGLKRAISVVHTDLPQNDFASLFQTLADDADSYLRGDDAVFASAVGRSFYEPILPASSVTLGWTSWAAQWLSRTPAEIPDHVQVAYSRDTAARAAFAAQADIDWRLFLTQRGRELRAGGKLVVLTMATRDDGRFGYEGVLGALCVGLEELRAGGFLDVGEVRRMAIPTVGRTRAEFAAPFAQEGRFGGLALERIDLQDGGDPFWPAFERDGDAQRFAAGWAAFSRASVFPTLARSLDGGGEARVHAFLQRLETAMAARLALAPERTIVPLAVLALRKE